MTSVSKIPVVDFSPCSLQIHADKLNVNVLEQTGKEICKAFHEVGFVYLRNHGIETQKVEQLFALMREFVRLPQSVKHSYSIKENGHGWMAMARESLNKARPHDLKESFSYLPQFSQHHPDPSQQVAGFSESVSDMFAQCYALSQRILEALGRGLNLADPLYFSKAHSPYTCGNLTALRTLYYPKTGNTAMCEGQIRCGEHSDWGSVTLLFQDQAGGLEVQSCGQFIPAPPIPGTVLVNIGDLLQQWSGGHFKSTVHRVVLPESAGTCSRQSMAFFAIPDDECEIVCLKGNNVKVTPPILTRDYMQAKMKAAKHY